MLSTSQKSAVSDVIIQWNHNIVARGAKGLTLNYLRNNGIWIISVNAAVRGVIHRCVTFASFKEK